MNLTMNRRSTPAAFGRPIDLGQETSVPGSAGLRPGAWRSRRIAPGGRAPLRILSAQILALTLIR